METQAAHRIHPLVAGASVAVIIAAGVAVAAITGHLPGSNAETAPTAPATSAKPSHNQQVASAKPTAHKPVAVCRECGTIVEVKEVEVLGKGTGVGAVAGHQIERQARKHVRYDITVHMTDGSTRKFSDESGAQIALKSGDKVRVGQDGTLKPI